MVEEVGPGEGVCSDEGFETEEAEPPNDEGVCKADVVADVTNVLEVLLSPVDDGADEVVAGGTDALLVTKPP